MSAETSSERASARESACGCAALEAGDRALERVGEQRPGGALGAAAADLLVVVEHDDARCAGGGSAAAAEQGRHRRVTGGQVVEARGAG